MECLNLNPLYHENQAQDVPKTPQDAPKTPWDDIFNRLLDDF